MIVTSVQARCYCIHRIPYLLWETNNPIISFETKICHKFQQQLHRYRCHNVNNRMVPPMWIPVLKLNVPE